MFPVPAEAQQYQFSAINISGNERVESATIASYAGIAPGQTVSMGELNAAFQRVQNSGLFEEVNFEPAGRTLNIQVREWPTINVINFEGNRRLNDEQLASVVQSQPRRVYSPSVAEADAAAITDLYAQSGRVAAEVTPRIIRRSNNRVDLVFAMREGNVVEVERLSFVGNRTYSDFRLRQVLETKQAGLLRTFVQRDTFLEERIELDKQLLNDFYQARGFIDFEVLNVTSELAQERDAFFITFTIREGQSYRVGSVDLVSEIEGVDTADFERELRLRPGVTFSPTIIETNIARLERVANQKGLRFARIEPRFERNDREQILDVTFAIVEGERIFVERIDIQGNTTTLDRVVRRQFRIVEGDPLNPREIREAAERIRALGYFSDVNVEGRQGSAEDQVVVDVDLEETTTGSLGFGVSYAINEGIGFSINFSERNFLGRGQQLDLMLNTSRDERQFNFNFVEPAFLDRDLRAGLSFVYRTTDTELDRDFNTKTIAISPSLGFPLTEFSRLNLRYTFTRDEIRDVDGGTSQIIKDEAGKATTSAFGYTYTYDTRGSDLNPTFGYLVRFDQELAGFGGDRRFVKTTALGSVERRIMNEDVTLRAELEGGALHMLSGDSRVTERFFMGDRMRGFRPTGIGPRDREADNRDALGGNMFAVARFEADFPIGLPEEYGISGGLFFDVGTVWGLDNRNGGPTGTDPVDDSLHWRAAVGFSIFWDTPIGPLRFNFSNPVRKLEYDRKQNFDLTISTRF
ncbi:outer membrane protein assembly factor BamA [Alkalilacustris brevis]|uniref:outer membrane protein assembly factor BamA n=1 Tax=Alkalilacustris brevis TaxID=2026338 RepID=UPI001EE3E22B|nr:outer membrane protein assembly factor BamA [Alkalilacustris brevis]